MVILSFHRDHFNSAVTIHEIINHRYDVPDSFLFGLSTFNGRRAAEEKSDILMLFVLRETPNKSFVVGIREREIS